MRLVACSECHTQFDVTDVGVKSFDCRCGATVENRELAPVDATILRCGSCGAIVAADVERCDYCGSSIERDPGKLSLICPECYARCAEDSRFCTACGVGFRPEPVRVEGFELPCPTCSMLMPPRQLGGIGLNECPGCNGLWVPGESFEHLLRRAIEARRSKSPEDLLGLEPRAKGANPSRQQVQYRKCPECQAFMHRRNYRKSSGVIIDVCHDHGTWLDADELEQVVGFILGGGATSPLLVEPEPGTGAARARAAAARIQAEAITRRSHRHESSAVGSLLDTLTRLLS